MSFNGKRANLYYFYQTLLNKAYVVKWPFGSLSTVHMVDGFPLRCQENPLTRNSSGVDLADFVLYVSAIQTLQCGETIGINIRIRIWSCETRLFETWAVSYELLHLKGVAQMS